MPDRRLAMTLALLLCPLLIGKAAGEPGSVAGPGDDGRWHAGAYSYSDEMGGFRIVAVSGIGTRDNPVEIAQEFESASPVTLSIRAERPVRLFGRPSAEFATGMLYVRLVAINGSGLPWIEYELELQEQPGEASTYGDGLSFDQGRRDGGGLAANSYDEYDLDFEPYDRVLFTRGVIDPGASGLFEIYITDFTPKRTIYLKQDPRAPYS
jgi:hypothetical protein